MKNIISIAMTISLFVACQNEQPKQGRIESEKATKEATQEPMKMGTDTMPHVHVFSCPMHPEITGKEGDKCPKCGMSLVHHD